MGTQEQLLAVTPLDGRYADKVEPLVPIVSEYGLIKRRVLVEASWLGELSKEEIPGVPPLSDEAVDELGSIVDSFDVEDALRVKEIEKTTNHDVKAVEMWLRERLTGNQSFTDYLELIHIGCTSEDISNLAYALMMRDARDKVLMPAIEEVGQDLDNKASSYADIPMLARTHGQPATPTTLGKEMAVFSERILDSAGRLGNVAILGKFNGASGNYSAITFAYPEVNWPSVSRRFVETLGLGFNGITTQIEPHDWMAVLFNEVALGNTIMTDLSRDMWAYISNGIFKQQVVAGEVGSSTMPHKVNPIDFENAEANFGIGNAVLSYLSGKLPISRLQRDLSDSSAQRAIGEAFGHTHVAHKSLQKGLAKVNPDTDRIAKELDGEWSVLTEAVQTIMRRYGVTGAYEAIKAVSRGKAFTKADYLELVASIDLPNEAKQRLLELTPQTYIGRASDLANNSI